MSAYTDDDALLPDTPVPSHMWFKIVGALKLLTARGNYDRTASSIIRHLRRFEEHIFGAKYSSSLAVEERMIAVESLYCAFSVQTNVIHRTHLAYTKLTLKSYKELGLQSSYRTKALRSS